jgi:hypothetical protein
VNANPGNLHALRPIRILLASDDDEFAARMATAAQDVAIRIDHIPLETNVEVALVRNGSNVYVLDAGDALGRAARLATAFAALHPSVPVILVADRAASTAVDSVPLLDKWRSAERLLGQIELAYLGLRI